MVWRVRAGALWVMSCHLLHSCGRALFQCRCARVGHDDHLMRLGHALIWYAFSINTKWNRCCCDLVDKCEICKCQWCVYLNLIMSEWRGGEGTMCGAPGRCKLSLPWVCWLWRGVGSGRCSGAAADMLHGSWVLQVSVKHLNTLPLTYLTWPFPHLSPAPEVVAGGVTGSRPAATLTPSRPSRPYSFVWGYIHAIKC